MSKTITNYETFVWVDLQKPTKDELLEQTQDFRVNVNLLEDVLEHGHLPKIEIFEDFSFIIFRAHEGSTKDKITTVGDLTNKIAFFVKQNRILTIHRADFPFLKKANKSYAHPQLLLIEILNDMLQSYEQPLQAQFEKIDSIEKQVFLHNNKSISIENLYYQKSKARIAKKILLLFEHVLAQLKIDKVHSSALEDLKDTTTSYVLQYDEIIEDTTTILNSYLSLNTQRSNETTKLLTIFSAFFLPLTFIAGIYGMNFDNMPELRSRNGYYTVLGAMVVVSLVIYQWFKRKKIL
jgi:magnesium transporter